MSANETTRRSDKSATDEEPSETVQKRAQWEAFEFAVPEPGRVRVENYSHGAENVDEHTYDVDIEHGSAVACSCPFDEYNAEACKHRTAVEANAPVLAAASGVVADGGVVTEETTDERPDDCECEPWMDDVDLPCFACHRAGYETPNPDLTEEEV
jgi:hypothetical protein